MPCRSNRCSATHLSLPQGACVAEAIDWALQPGNIAPEVQAQLAEHLPGPDGVSVTDMVWNVTKVRRLAFVCLSGLCVWNG